MSAGATKAAFRACEKMAARSGSNFYYTFWTLPRQQHADMCALYAFMRSIDDIADDETTSISERRDLLQSLKNSLSKQALLASDSPILIAIDDLIVRRDLPVEYLITVIDGVESDLTPRRFQTYHELEHYCFQVAGAVGLCCLSIWETPVTDNVRRQAIQCGNAFQLTNILRDLREDALRGRCYLPMTELAAYSYTEQELSQGACNDRFQKLMQFQIQRAKAAYQESQYLRDELKYGRMMYDGMHAVYAALLKKIEADPCRALHGKVNLSRWEKLSLLCQSCWRGNHVPSPSN